MRDIVNKKVKVGRSASSPSVNMSDSLWKIYFRGSLVSMEESQADALQNAFSYLREAKVTPLTGDVSIRLEVLTLSFCHDEKRFLIER